MMMKETLIVNWEEIFTDYFVTSAVNHSDAAHDIDHFRRVANTAKEIASQESEIADPLILLAAAYFHDVISLPKNHPDSKKSSSYSAIKAQEILANLDFPTEKIPAVCHAIEAHSFSARLQAETIEAKIIQDADRMESLGTLGVIRTFYVSGLMKGTPYDATDLFAERRPLDDKSFALDHFYNKLFKLPELLQTAGGRCIAAKRTAFLQIYIEALVSDLKRGEGGALVLTWACYNAGRNNAKLFHPVDPLARNRILAPDQYAIDRLLEVRYQFPEFVLLFLSQFSEEIGVNRLIGT